MLRFEDLRILCWSFEALNAIFQASVHVTIVTAIVYYDMYNLLEKILMFY